MRHILQGFTMFIEGSDYGFDTEEVEIPFPNVVRQDYRGGGMDVGVKLGMAALEPLEAKVKMAGSNPNIMKLVGRGPGQTVQVTFRGAVMSEVDGTTVPHVAIINGQFNEASRDRWQRGEKSGIEYTLDAITYYRYEADVEIVHEIQAWPPRRIINGVDQLGGINNALGY